MEKFITKCNYQLEINIWQGVCVVKLKVRLHVRSCDREVCLFYYVQIAISDFYYAQLCAKLRGFTKKLPSETSSQSGNLSFAALRLKNCDLRVTRLKRQNR